MQNIADSNNSSLMKEVNSAAEPSGTNFTLAYRIVCSDFKYFSNLITDYSTICPHYGLSHAVADYSSQKAQVQPAMMSFSGFLGMRICASHDDTSPHAAPVPCS